MPMVLAASRLRPQARRGIVLAAFGASTMIVRYFLALATVLFLASCADVGTTTPLPVPSTPPATLVSFNGTLQPRGTDTYLFTVRETGYVEATLLGLAAPSSTTVGLGIGT